uniref:putative methyltransferase DDB_G0268948 n=1 Tax=Styela clava TaxID=7725 RepID=UPI00193ACC88|nr:putative methyltransferase DDB_G0268948 [Styela clava]
MLKGFEGLKHAELYAKYRITYPYEVTRMVIDYAKKNKSNGQLEHMVDVGCGNGQSTEIYKDYVGRITAIDTSESQIAVAKKNEKSNITYLVATGECLPVEENSVDLICSGQAIHWIDFPKFWAESRRVLKPDGSMVFYGYGLLQLIPEQMPVGFDETTMNEKATELLLKLHYQCKFHERIDHVNNRYVEIFDMIPSNEKSRDDSIFITRHWNMNDLKNFLSTWSGYQTYLREKKADDPDILRQYLDNLKQLLGMETSKDEDIQLRVSWNVFVIFSKRPS